MLAPQPSVLLSRIAATLEHDVLPQMAPSYACTEVEAAVTMLRNLAGRVEWRREDLSDDLARADEALATMTGARNADTREPLATPTFDDLHDARERLGSEIDNVFARGDDAPVAALAAVLAGMVEAEEQRNRRGA